MNIKHPLTKMTISNYRRNNLMYTFKEYKEAAYEEFRESMVVTLSTIAILATAVWGIAVICGGLYCIYRLFSLLIKAI